MFDRIDRVMVPVRDVDRAAQWYEQMFGLRVISRSGNEALLAVGRGETLLSLERSESGHTLGHLHREGHVPGFNFYTHWDHLHRAWLTLRGVETTEIMTTPHMNVNEFFDGDGNVVGLCHEKAGSLYYTPQEEAVPPIVHRVLAAFIPVRDLEASIRWYTGMLGFELCHHWGQGADLKVGRGETIVTMILMDEHVHRNAVRMTEKLPYFSLQTTDIHRAYDALSDRCAVPGRFSDAEGCFDVASPEGLVLRVRGGERVPV
ncbi:VOC family protein [Paenibacillus hamazuiensis]|uniref:VOC family protein n=1 Tax=Paenibacillus hamazuiensis TaxID=2936508 RepID=UPI0020109A37|nr:VOC family protein [Paenibacillus hamazuiensis]